MELSSGELAQEEDLERRQLKNTETGDNVEKTDRKDLRNNSPESRREIQQMKRKKAAKEKEKKNAYCFVFLIVMS